MTRDPLDGPGPRDRGLTELFGHLTSEPSADELSGEYAALTMFRTATRSWGTSSVSDASTAGGAHAAPTRPARPRRVSRARLAGRLVAAATVAALAGGFAAAGYAEVLPPPLQHLAHRILGFAGVPNSPPNPSSERPRVPVTSRRTTPGSSSSPQPRSPGTTSPPRSGSPSPGRTSSPSPSPHRSLPVIAVTEVSRARGQSELLVVSVTLAKGGGVVELFDLADGQWQLLRAHRLHQGATTFLVVARKISVTYRVVLPLTAEHGRSVSGLITVAAHPKKGGQNGQGGH